MALTNTVSNDKTVDSGDKNGGLWVTIPKDSTIDIAPLVNYDEITVYQQYKFGEGKGFWTIPDTQADNDPCRLMGFVPEKGYIMPVIVYDKELKAWDTEPKFYRFTKSVLAGMKAIGNKKDDELGSIYVFANEESEPAYQFKHAIIKIIRDDTTKKGFTQYSVSWTGRHLSKNASMKNNLPENTLDMIAGILPFKVEDTNDDNEIRRAILKRLQEKSDFVVDGKSIGERMKEAGLLSEESEFEMVNT